VVDDSARRALQVLYMGAIIAMGRKMRRQLAVTVAVLYWSTVLVSYIVAAIAHDEFGLAFVPFFFLSLPWSVPMNALANQITNHGAAATTFALSCWLLSGINALVLYFLIARGPLVLRKLAGQAKR
jgi:hypothetical protein